MAVSDSLGVQSEFSPPWKSDFRKKRGREGKMGGEGKSRKRRSSPSSSNDEDEKSRKHRKREETERKSRKDDDKKKKKTKKKSDDKSHKHSRSREGKEHKSREKHKHSRRSLDSFEELTKDDYFSKNNEFSAWLKEEKGIYFSDLSSEAARDLFSGFMKDWNKQKLQPQYYEGIASGPRTAHNWKIKA